MSEQPISRVQPSPRPAPPEWFEGRVEMEPVHETADPPLRQGRVHFHDGAHTRWHLHLGDQVLYFVEGLGMAEDSTGVRFDCVPGDIVHVPRGTRHIHGARPGASASHVAITAGETVWDIDPRYPR
jgi:quercetin dioxygenase-like cupin family protein